MQYANLTDRQRNYLQDLKDSIKQRADAQATLDANKQRRAEISAELARLREADDEARHTRKRADADVWACRRALGLRVDGSDEELELLATAQAAQEVPA